MFIHNKNQQILIHDIRKHLTAIAQLNRQNEHEKIQQYLDALLNSSDLLDSVRVSDNEMLNSIFCHYIKICHDKHIKFRADIRTNLLQKLNFPELLPYSATCWIMQWKHVMTSPTHLLK